MMIIKRIVDCNNISLLLSGGAYYRDNKNRPKPETKLLASPAFSFPCLALTQSCLLLIKIPLLFCLGDDSAATVEGDAVWSLMYQTRKPVAFYVSYMSIPPKHRYILTLMIVWEFFYSKTIS
jgi:hypothetical protein